MSTILIREIETLQTRVVRLSIDVEERLRQSLLALTNRDAALAQSIIDRDDEVDRREVEIEEECLKILALHQPMGSDLRLVVAMLKINNDLERIADIAVNIADRARRMDAVADFGLEPSLQRMGGAASAMVHKALEAFMRQEAELAREVIGMDDDLDDLHRDTIEEVTRRVKAGDVAVDSLLLLLGVSRDIERVGDHATNIAEDLIYMFTGAIVRHGHAPLPQA